MSARMFRLAAAFLAVAAPAVGQEMPEFLPVPVGEDGVGILRHAIDDPAVTEVWLAIGGRTENPERPLEILVGDIGPYSGPEVAVFVPYIMHSAIPRDRIGFVLYSREPARTIAYFAPVTDPAAAEGAEACGTVSEIGECAGR